MTELVLGTANLFALVDPAASRAVLRAAWDAGVRRFDTAPSYGYGESEQAVADLVRGRRDEAFVSTKVGLAPASRPSAARKLAKAAARTLPAAVLDRVREAGASPRPRGEFAADAVRAGVRESLRRLGRIDRLLLHEVDPADIGEPLLETLAPFLDSGEVGSLGVATGNERTAAALARAPETLRAAHVEVGVSAAAVELPPGVVRVGHGVFGAGGSDLAAARAVLSGGGEIARRWHRACADFDRSAESAIAAAMIARAGAGATAELIVATSRPDRIAGTLALVTGRQPVPPELVGSVDALVTGH